MFMVATDPEGKYYSPDKIAGTKAKILDMIRASLRVRGVEADD
jgi:hypothetical protein